MTTNKIIVWTNPTAPFQKVYVMKDGALVEQMGVMPNNLKDIVCELVDKYQITDVDFSGTQSFAEHFMDDLKNNQVTKYSAQQLNINFI